jgi:hypothetical protein
MHQLSWLLYMAIILKSWQNSSPGSMYISFLWYGLKHFTFSSRGLYFKTFRAAINLIQQKATFSTQRLQRLLALPTNISLGWTCLAMTNSLTSYYTELMNEVKKSFKVQIAEVRCWYDCIAITTLWTYFFRLSFIFT